MIRDRENDPKVTILTGSRNCLPYIGQCIRSVLSQSYKNWEMIIVDDCSTDRTFKRAVEITKKHSNITVVQNKSRHYCGANYNKILSLATGDICGVLDGDDVLPKHAIETLVNYYNKYPNIDFIWTQHRWYNKDMTKYRSGISGKPRGGSIYQTERKLRHSYSHWRTFRTYLRDKAQLFDPNLKCAVDKDLGYSLEEVGRGGFLNKQLYYYRYHPHNMSHKTNQRQSWRRIREKHKGKDRYESTILS